MEHTQRWAERQPRWVPKRQVADTSRLEVALIGEAEAKAFVTAHHYSGSYPAARLRVGLLEAGELVGAAVYSEPGNARCIPKWSGGAYARDQGVDLGRFVLLDRVGYNAESWFWSRARRLLRVHKPGVRFILAYSDPMARATLAGEVVLPGHVGCVYQATNAAYLGRASSKTLFLDAEGREVSPRAMTKIARRAKGHAYATRRLEEASKTRKRPRESWGEWVERAKSRLRKSRHPGNHVYAWPVRASDCVPRSLPYPKTIDPVQLGLL